MTITYKHYISGKTLTDTVLSENENSYFVDRSTPHSIRPLQVYKSDVIDTAKTPNQL